MHCIAIRIKFSRVEMTVSVDQHPAKGKSGSGRLPLIRSASAAPEPQDIVQRYPVALKLRGLQRSVRKPGQSQPGRRERLDAGPLSLNFISRTASAHGQSIPLTGVEFQILEVLMQQQGVVVSREQLTRQVLGRRLTPYDRSIDTHISNIRRKLAPVVAGVSIVNVRRSGYVFTIAEGADPPAG